MLALECRNDGFHFVLFRAAGAEAAAAPHGAVLPEAAGARDPAVVATAAAPVAGAVTRVVELEDGVARQLTTLPTEVAVGVRPQDTEVVTPVIIDCLPFYYFASKAELKCNLITGLVVLTLVQLLLK